LQSEQNSSSSFALNLARAIEEIRPEWTPLPHQVHPLFDRTWDYWLLLAGRGTGKTDAGSYAVDEYMGTHPGARGRIIAPTQGDARESCVIGPSGIIAHNPKVHFNHTDQALVWPNGSRVKLLGAYTPEDVERLRANTNSDIDWYEELAAWPKLDECWDQANLGRRRGERPPVIITTTPKNKPRLRWLLGMPVPDRDWGPVGTVVLSTATTDDNPHLSDTVRKAFYATYGQGRTGRQELGGELLLDVEGALWSLSRIEDTRVSPRSMEETKAMMARIVVGIDPAGGNTENNDETGIIVAGLGSDGHGYVLEDLSCKASPDAWASKAVQAYHRWQADRVVGEINYGGAMVEYTIKTVDPTIPFLAVTATRGKRVRAEPVAALYEQNKVHHMGGFPRLEDQMVTFEPEKNEKSPDRVDALVWCLWQLALDNKGAASLQVLGDLLSPAPVQQAAPEAPAPPATQQCGFNACTNRDAEPALIGGQRVPLCPMHLAELTKLKLATSLGAAPTGRSWGRSIEQVTEGAA